MKDIKDMYEKAREEMQEQVVNPNLLEERLMGEGEAREGREEPVLRGEAEEDKQDKQASGVELKYQLRSHMDSVRGLRFVEAIDSLVSVSEDCTVKLWSIKTMMDKAEQGVQVEPYVSLRGHTGPLFTMEAGCKLESS